MGGRRKRADQAFETFDGAGASCGLKLELAPANESGYAGVFPTTSKRWQAVIRVERGGRQVRRNIGTFENKEGAAVQRALVIIGSTGVLSPADRANRGSGALPLHLCPPPYPTLSHHASVCACHRRCEGACKGRRLRYDPHGQPHRHHLRRRIGTGSASHCAPACRCPMPPLWQMWAETSRPHVLVWECWRAGRIATRRGFRPSANRSARAQFGLDGVW